MKRFFLHTLYKIYTLKNFFTRPIIIGVRVMLLRNGDEVLLVKHSYQDGWLLPGGGTKRGETIEQAARRECREEIGAEVGEMQLVGVYTQFVHWKTDHIVLFKSEDFTITPKTDIEIECAKFFNMRELPSDMMPGSRRRIEAHLQGQPVPRSGNW
ncbi:MAG: NUDIX domain-containing protein [Anaerolineales bacterium]